MTEDNARRRFGIIDAVFVLLAIALLGQIGLDFYEAYRRSEAPVVRPDRRERRIDPLPDPPVVRCECKCRCGDRRRDDGIGLPPAPELPAK
jgi:hypothetical protein